MSRRRRTLILSLLALAVPLPAYAITNEVLSPTAGPQSISVSASLDSCGVLEDGVVCKIDVSFSEVSGASSYSATVTRADGSVIDYGSLGAGGGSIWVPYVGAGNYSVKVTAYGEPESADDPDGRGAVIATGYSRDAAADGPKGSESGDGDQVETEAGSSAPGSATLNNPDGAASTEAGSSAETPAEATTPAPETTTTCTPSTVPAAPTAPAEPPEDLDPENLDEDADGIPDEQERAAYEQQLAEYQAALAAQQEAAAAAAATGC